MRILVVAPHPDDEVLGVGGTMARYADEGQEVNVVIVTKGESRFFDAAAVDGVREEARAAHRLLGIANTTFLDFPAARLDQVEHRDLNIALGEVVRAQSPDIVFIPFRGDIHLDHQLVADSAMVAVRPTNGITVSEVYAYETLSETNWNASRGITAAFVPDCYVRIPAQIERKLVAFRMFASQLRDFPHERSVEALEALARFRGATIGVAAAEAFMTIRRIL